MKSWQSKIGFLACLGFVPATTSSLPDLPKTTQFLRFKMGFVDQVSLHQAASISEEKFGRIHTWVHHCYPDEVDSWWDSEPFSIIGANLEAGQEAIGLHEVVGIDRSSSEPELKVLMEEIPPRERGLKLWELFVNLPPSGLVKRQ